MAVLNNASREDIKTEQMIHWSILSDSIYKMVETDKIINIETMKQEIEDNKVIRNSLKEEEENTEVNHYQMAVLNNASREDIKTEQMIHWSILSDSIKYIDRSSCLDMIPSLSVTPLDYQQHKRLYNSLKPDKDLTHDMIFEGYKVGDEYFDRHDGINAEISQATKFDESTDLSRTYLGKMDMTGDQIIKAEEKFQISGQEYTNGKLLGNTECSLLIDTGASKSYMSKSNYMQCKLLHILPKLASTILRVQVGNG